jgi:hypothetical protein
MVLKQALTPTPCVLPQVHRTETVSRTFPGGLQIHKSTQDGASSVWVTMHGAQWCTLKAKPTSL